MTHNNKASSCELSGAMFGPAPCAAPPTCSEEGVSRLVQNMEFKRADAEWITQWNPGWAKSAYGPVLSPLLSALSATQRCALGFPPPAHPFWTAVRGSCTCPR